MAPRLFLVAPDQTLEHVAGARAGSAAAIRAIVHRYENTIGPAVALGSPAWQSAHNARTAALDTLAEADTGANLLHSLIDGDGLYQLQAVRFVHEAGHDPETGSTDDLELMLSILNIQRNYVTSEHDLHFHRAYNRAINRACTAVMAGAITTLAWG